MRDSITNTVREYYDAGPQAEWDRANEGTVEYIITSRILGRHITPGSSVLDLGGGPGRYSLWLAARGNDVTLFDLSPGNVAFAREKADAAGLPLKTVCGNAADAAMFPDTLYDHVLVMGPMYHLSDDGDRRKVLRNALDRLKPSGRIFITFIQIFAGIGYYMDEAPEGLGSEIDSGNDYVDAVAANMSWYGMAFTQARFDSLKDIRGFCGGLGLEQPAYYGQEGMLGCRLRHIEALPEPHKSLWIELAYRMCGMEEYLNMSSHVLFTGRKP